MELLKMAQINVDKKLANPKVIPKILEDEPTLKKFLENKPYTKEEMKKCALNIFKLHSLDAAKYFILPEDKFEKNNADKMFESTEPMFCIYEEPKECWAVFCFFKKDAKSIFVLHIEPKGLPISLNIEQKILKINNLVKIVNYTKIEKDSDDLYGAFCLRNLNYMITYYLQDKNNFVDNFLELKFCTMSDLTHIKIKEATRLMKEISNKTEFLKQLKEFINLLPMELGKKGIDYTKVMEEELKKGEDGYNEENLKDKKVNPEEIEEYRDKFKNAKNNDQNFQLKMQADFQKETQIFLDIFKIFEHMVINEELFTALKVIAVKLNLDYENLKMLYTSKQKEEKEFEKVSITNIDTIVKKFPDVGKINRETDGTPASQLVKEIQFGIDGDKTNHDADRDLLLKNCNLVKEKMLFWTNATARDINDWAKQKKGKLAKTTDDICTALAVINRGYNIVKRHHLRDTQLIAVLTFFHQPNRGILLQIQTGQGKTTTVAIVAIIKVLQGQNVDVITSNPILAQEGVDETVHLYNLFDISVDTNNVSVGHEPKISYQADVLYGTISNFQYDYLRDNVEGVSIRFKRRFGHVIMDEVDSMLIDNGGHIAKLSQPYPGMDTFRYIYIKIWQELQIAEEQFKIEMTTKIQQKINDLKAEKDLEKRKTDLTAYINELCKNERKYLEDKIKASNPHKIPLIPKHLRSYAEKKLDIWIKNAIQAKYTCEEHKQYRIIIDENTKEKMLAPVDYLNTGVTLKNTIWSHGLHQFVQLKHNLFLTYESLTSSFISNIGYIKNYPEANIFGMTGTMGSTAEQNLLAGIYGVTFAKIPPYKPKVFQELPGLVFSDNDWDQELSLNVLEYIEKERAVIVLCETGADLYKIKANLENLQKVQKLTNMKIRIFANEDQADETKEKADIGHVIISTNIASRGTNFKTTNNLETKGGLHVCVGFLPCNQRVEGQAFGRTSRQGKVGTAQLVIRQSEVEELKLPSTERDFSKIKAARDELEKLRLKDITDNLAKELVFKDDMFNKFAKEYKVFKSKSLEKEHHYLVQDLKEFWAFWLESKDYTSKNIVNLKAKDEFQLFMDEAKPILNGEVYHNPYYCVAIANQHLETEKYDLATDWAQKAIDMSAGYDLMIGAHVKLFEIAMRGNGVAMERINKALTDIIGFNYHKNEDYKMDAESYLEEAVEIIDLELNYIEKNCAVTENVNENPFNKILIRSDLENTFVKHIYGRYILLRIYKENFLQLKEQLKSENDLFLSDKFVCDIDNLSNFFNKEDIQKISINEVQDLEAIGLDSIYHLKTVKDVDKPVVDEVRSRILAGVGLLSVGFIFLPFLPFVLPIATIAIAEGLFNIVYNIWFSDDKDFHKASFIRDKIISYSIKNLKLQPSAIIQSVKILTVAVKICCKFANVLRKSEFLKNLFSKLALQVDTIQKTCAKLLDDKTGLERSAITTEPINVLKNLAKYKCQDLSNQTKDTLIKKYVTQPILDQTLESLVEIVRNNFKEQVVAEIRKNSEICRKIIICLDEKLDEIINNFFTEKDVLSTNIANDIISRLQNGYAPAIINLADTSIILKNVTEIVTNFIKYFNTNLPKEGFDNNHLDFYIPKIGDKISIKLVENIMKIINKSTNLAIGFKEDENITNPYQILGVNEKATIAEIKKTFLRFAMGCNDINDNGGKKFDKVQKAYNNLCEKNKQQPLQELQQAVKVPEATKIT